MPQNSFAILIIMNLISLVKSIKLNETGGVPEWALTKLKRVLIDWVYGGGVAEWFKAASC
jgi:hypothetical protein